MSRILRRPMFRGGRVDARGTGIASGLGYNNGGRVGYNQGNLVAPLYNAAQATSSPSWSFQGALQGIYNALNPSPETLLERIQSANPPDFGPDSVEPYIKTRDWEKRKGAWEQGEADKAEAEKQKEIDAAVAAAEAEQNESNNLTGGDGLPEKTKAEKLEEYQAMFEEAYGTGRGEDISNMLLSFAGKALKPEATVKSSFGEFFADEAKRPSESKKYKDAATTAAINAFLTGEKTMAETESFMNRTDYTNTQKLALADKVQRGYSMNDFVLNRKQGETKSEALEGGARKKVDFGQYKEFEKIKSKHNTEKLIDQEYVGVIFMDEGTREVFTIIIGEDGKPAKQILYGV